MPVKSSTVFRAVQFHFETTTMQLTQPDFTSQQQGRSSLSTKPELSYREDATLILRSLQQRQLVTSSKINPLHSHLSVIGNLMTILSLKPISYFPSFHAVALDYGEVPPYPFVGKTRRAYLNIYYS